MHSIKPSSPRRGLHAAAFFLLLSLAAQAGTLYIARLSSANENPPTAAIFTGTGVLILNDAETQAIITATHNITLPVTGGHIHRGTATLNGPVIFPFPAPTSPVGPLTWNIPAADVDNLKNQGLYMNFHTAANPGGAIRATLFRALLGPAATTPAQSGLANVLDISAGYNADLDTILVQTNLADAATQARTLGDLTAGTVYVQSREQLESLASLGAGLFSYLSDTRDQPPGAAHKLNVFLRAGHESGQRSASANQVGADLSRPTVQAGIDYQLGPSTRAGLAVGYVSARDSFDGGFGRTTTKTKAIDGFLSFALGDSGAALDATAGYGSASIHTTRNLPSLARTATGSTDGKAWGGALRASVPFKLTGQLSLVPYALFDVQKAMVDGYTETGANSVNLVMPDRTMWSSAFEAGASLLVPVKLDSGTLGFRLQAGWRALLEDGSGSSGTRLAGSPIGFGTQYDGARANTAHVEASVEFAVGHGLLASVGYRGLIASGSNSVHAIEGTVIYKF